MPRIVGAEVPNVPFRIATGIAAPLAVLVLDVEDDVGSRPFGPGAVRTRVGNEQIADLCLDAAHVRWVLHERIEIGAIGGGPPEHSAPPHQAPRTPRSAPPRPAPPPARTDRA